MAYIIATGNVPQTQRLRELKDALILAYNAAARINRELDQMSDAQVTEQYGVPSGSVAVFRTTIDEALASLTSTAVTNVISSLGFTV